MTIRHRLHLTLSAALCLLSAGSALAQAPDAAAATPGIDQRQMHQRHRIEQGLASGSLTMRESHRLVREQHAIARAERHAKADGTVTAQERRRLHHMQDGAGRDIRRQKHDRQHAPGATVSAG
jgi:hypothetical protein